MKFSFLVFILSALSLVAFLPSNSNAAAPITVGELAPDFTAVDTNGITHTLSDFRDKNVVLEWSNHLCPFVKKHYEPGNMQKLQKEATEGGAIWLTIVSSAEGKQGHVSADKANKIMQDVNAHSTARILDKTGKIGRLYDAKTTPHMFVIDKEGTLVYAGAIDSDSSFSSSAIAGATNYVREALNSLKAGNPIKTASTKPYGCSVKY